MPHWLRSNSPEAEPEAGILVQVMCERRALRTGSIGDTEQGREHREDCFRLERSFRGRLELTLTLTCHPQEPLSRHHCASHRRQRDQWSALGSVQKRKEQTLKAFPHLGNQPSFAWGAPTPQPGDPIMLGLLQSSPPSSLTLRVSSTLLWPLWHLQCWGQGREQQPVPTHHLVLPFQFPLILFCCGPSSEDSGPALVGGSEVHLSDHPIFSSTVHCPFP